MYLYVQTTVPSQVTGFGVSVEPINTGTTVRPQASVIFAGAPGSTAAAGQLTVDDPLAGGVNPPL